MRLATDHITEAYWAARAAKRTEAASHLMQALWPPKSLCGAYALDPAMRDAVAQAYNCLLARHRFQAVAVLQRIVYPEGIPAREVKARKAR